MNDIRSEEQQQIEDIKNWIQEHALSLIAAVVVFCAVIFGPDWYKSYKNSQIWPASDTYEQFSNALAQAQSGAVSTNEELQMVDQLADLLVEQYGDSQYAFLASLGAAKLSADLGNFEVALSRLQWAEQNPGNEADSLLVNYRIALLEAEVGQTDSALARLSESNTHFAALYADARGDIHTDNGSIDEAVAAYEEALLVAENGTDNSLRNSIQLKLNSLQFGLGSSN